MIITNISKYNNKMKQIEFKTSKGEFILVDETDLPKIDKLLIEKDSNLIKLSDITEEQASKVVQADEYFHGRHYYRNYINEDGKSYRSPIESLHSLLKSKGIHLYENPYEDPCTGKNDKGLLSNSCIDSCQGSCWKWLDYTYEDMEEAETKTFYNPYIFKKV